LESGDRYHRHFYTGKNYAGTSHVYAAGVSDGISLNPGTVATFYQSAKLTQSIPYQSNLQQIGTYINGVYKFWSWAQIGANMQGIVYAAQNANPSVYTSTVVQSLLAAVANLSCTTLINSLTPIPDNLVTAETCSIPMAVAAKAAAVAAEQAAVQAKTLAAANVIAAQAAIVAAEKVAAEAQLQAAANVLASQRAAAVAAEAALLQNTKTPVAAASSTTSTTSTVLGLKPVIFYLIIVAIVLFLSSSSAGVLWKRKRAN